MILFYYVCLVLFIASSVLLACAAARAGAGKPAFGLDGPGAAFRALAIQALLLLLSTPAVYGSVRGRSMAGMTIIFVIGVLGLPIVCSTYYYVTVLGGFLGRSIFTPGAALPGTEVPEIDRARALAAGGDPAGAAAMAERFLEEHPQNLEALRYLAALELGRGRFERCAQLCRRALEADAAIRATRTGLAEEGRADLLSLLADALERAGRAHQAARVIEESLESLRTERYRRTLAERARRLRGEL